MTRVMNRRAALNLAVTGAAMAATVPLGLRPAWANRFTRMDYSVNKPVCKASMWGREATLSA